MCPRVWGDCAVLAGTRALSLCMLIALDKWAAPVVPPLEPVTIFRKSPHEHCWVCCVAALVDCMDANTGVGPEKEPDGLRWSAFCTMPSGNFVPRLQPDD